MAFLKLLSAATATNSPPSGATAGFSLRSRQPGIDGAQWNGKSDGVILVRSSAGTGTMTVTLRMWGYSPLTANWHPLGTNATMASRGVLNQGNAITEDGSDILTHAETVTGLAAFTRIYLEITAIGGTNTAINAYLVGVDDGSL
jgi:hypothetical protein